jgi:hypothetical protein
MATIGPTRVTISDAMALWQRDRVSPRRTGVRSGPIRVSSGLTRVSSGSMEVSIGHRMTMSRKGTSTRPWRLAALGLAPAPAREPDVRRHRFYRPATSGRFGGTQGHRRAGPQRLLRTVRKRAPPTSTPVVPPNRPDVAGLFGCSERNGYSPNIRARGFCICDRGAFPLTLECVRPGWILLWMATSWLLVGAMVAAA